jgi:hypothetical protein
VDDRQPPPQRSHLPVPPARPWGSPAPEPARVPNQPGRPPRRSRRNVLSVAIFLLLVLGVGIRAFRDLSRPDAWDYWRDLYSSPSLTSSLLDSVDLNGRHRALALRGKIGPAAASWFRERLDEAHLTPGDVVVMSSPGGDLAQGIIMGEVIRSRGLATAVGAAEASGRIGPASCASACVFVIAGGKTRYGVEGSRLGVHRFTATTTSSADSDPVADTQRVTGLVLNYLTRMGISASLVEAMTATSNIRWLGAQEGASMKLVTDPVRGP